MKYGLLIFLLIKSNLITAQPLSVSKLTCNWRTNPLGVESPAPQLSWQLSSTERGLMQTAYRILVADDSLQLAKGTGNVWDSKRLLSDASINVRYLGPSLRPAKTYFWKVMVWDNHNHTAVSKIGSWQTGLPQLADWKGAKWIAYEKLPDSLLNPLPTDGKRDTYFGSNVLPLLRKSFVVKKAVKSATLFISGLGHFEASINGEKIGDHFLDPGWTQYTKEALYVPFDVTKQVKKGSAVIGVMLGNGFYYVPPVQGRYRKLKPAFGFPKLICHLTIEYSDGTTEEVVSDQTWKAAASPVTFSSIYGGEDYDARLEQTSWNQPAFNASSWKQAIVVDGPPELKSQSIEPMRVMEQFAPKSIRTLLGDTLIYDLGQNASGIVRLTIRGKRGDTVRIFPGELLRPSGSVAQRASGGPYYWQYILKGDSGVVNMSKPFSSRREPVVRSIKMSNVETWQPRFSYYGFRYLQVVGAAASAQNNSKSLPVIVEINGLHTRNAATTIGAFQSSNTLFNQTNELIDWSIKSNMASVFTDCPHREKLGWLEQTYLMGNSVHFRYDAATLFRKTLADMRSAQLPDGLVPEIAPEYVKFDWGGGMFRDSPEWGSAAVILPWYMYKWYGDEDVLKENYAMMKRYIAYLQTKAKGNILSQGLGDWYDIGPKPPGASQQTPMGVTGTAIYYYDLNILSQVASQLKHDEEAPAYRRLAEQVKQSFNDSFYHSETKQYTTGSQTANAMALYMRLAPEEDRAGVLQNLVADIRAKGLTAGDIGYRFVLAALHEAGRDDVIFEMNNRSDVPGYGMQLAKGATALTESWQALPTVSNNHFMLGHLMEWFYTGLGGIKQSDSSIAYREIVIEPKPVGDVNFTKASFESPNGLVKSNWRKTTNGFELDVEVPVNATATVYLPGGQDAVWLEAGKPVINRKEIKLLPIEAGKNGVLIGSGRYHFTTTTNGSKTLAD